MLRQSKFVEACAFDSLFKYFNPVWVFYQLGMYRKALNTNYDLSYKTLFAKVISSSYIGDEDSMDFYLNLFKKKYPNRIKYLILPLSTYSPLAAFSLVKRKDDVSTEVLILLTYRLNKEKILSKNVHNYLLESSCNSIDLKLLHSNIFLLDNFKKLHTFNSIIEQLGLRSVALKSEDFPFCVNNLYSQPRQIALFEMPLVTVLVPTYNIRDRLASCIESLVNQDYPNIEIIVIDDCSTDNTTYILRELCEKYPTVRAIFLPVNVGPFVAKNIGLLHAKGEFVTTQDADDWAHPERIYRQLLPLLEDRNLVATTCNWVRLDDMGNFYVKQLTPYIRFNPSSPMFRKNLVLENVGYWHPARMAADTEYSERLKLVFGKHRIKSIKLPLVVGAHRENSLMTASITGNLLDKISDHRIDYWESWRSWHIETTRSSKKPFVGDFLGFEYIFPIPDLMKNDPIKISVLQDFLENLCD